MRKFWKKYKIVIFSFFVWRILLFIIDILAPRTWPIRSTFLGQIHWANFDGEHYLFIARAGYGLYEQAFFPLYSVCIRLLSFLPIPLPYVGLLISHISFLVGILFFYDLAAQFGKQTALWAVLFLLAFPTSFFFVAVYSTSLFFMLSVITFSACMKKRWLFAGIVGALASVTRLAGVFLFVSGIVEYMKRKKPYALKDLLKISLIPAGLASYMWYLYSTVGDPLYFLHVQTNFGAHRNDNGLIILPQVLWRYMKIFTSVSAQTSEYVIAVFEFVVFIFFVTLLVQSVKDKFKWSYIVYSFLILFIPTLTGTLSSMPRYVLDAFPLFFVLANMHNSTVKIVLLIAMTAGLIVCASAYLQGYFIA